MILLRIYHGIMLFLTFLLDLFKSSYQVFLFSISPEPLWKPGFVKINYSPELTKFQVTLLSHIITATPGTLTVNVDHNRCEISVHVLYLGLNTPKEISLSAQKTERRIRNAF